MATIQLPKIENKGFWRREQYRLLENYQEQYNAGKPSRERLKAEHMRLLRWAQHYAFLTINERTYKMCQLRIKDAAMDSQEWVRIRLSKYLEGSKLENKRTPRTIANHLNRLEIAGAIIRNEDQFKAKGLTKNHRHEVLINPDLLLIYDAARPNYHPESPFFTNTDYQNLINEIEKKQHTVSGKVLLPESNKNEIMTVDSVDKGVSHPLDELIENNRNTTQPDATPQQAKGSSNLQGKSSENAQKVEKTAEPRPEQKASRAENSQKTAEIRPEQRARGAEIDENIRFEAQKITERERKEQRIREVAVDLYCFMVEMLFKFHNIYPAEATMSIEYIAQKYLSAATRESELQKFAKQFKWRISKAASYWNRHNYDNSNIYPMRYLDVNYQYGFAQTREWFEKNQRDEARRSAIREKEKLQREEQSMIQGLVGIYEDSNRSWSVFSQHRKYISDNYPHLINQYMQEIRA